MVKMAVGAGTDSNANPGLKRRAGPATKVAPAMLSAPGLSGPGRVGATLRVDPGVWSGVPAPSVTLRWRRNGVDVPGATALEYVPGAADDGAELGCAVTASNASGTASAVTDAVRITYPAPVVAGALADLVLDQGQGARTLDASAAFTGAALVFGVAGAGATVDTTTGLVSIPLAAPRAAETVTVTATNSGGSVSVSFAVTVVAAPVLTPPVSTVAPSLSGSGRVGTPMLVDPGLWSGDPTPVLSFAWRRNGADISGATGAEYTPVAADEGADLDCVVTAVNAAGSAEAATGTVRITHPAPVVAGAPADLVLDQGPGARTLDVSLAFTGAALVFGVSGAGATVDPATGAVSIPLDTPRAAETVTVTATNSGGAASVSFAVTVLKADTAAPVLTAGAIDADATPAALSIASNEGGVAYWMIDANTTRTGTQVETGGGEGSGSFAAASGSNTHDVDVSGLAAGVWHVHTMVKDAAGNRSNVISTPFEIEEAAAPPGGITLGRSAVVINDTTVNGAVSYTGGPFTVGSEAARILVAIIHGYSTTNQTVPTDIAVSFGGVAMTQRQAPVIQAFQRAWTAIYTLTAPASGTATLLAAWTLATRAAAITLVEVSGVDQSAPVVASGSQLYGSGANVTAAAFTRADGDLILSGLALGSGGKGSEIATDGTLLQSGQTGAAGTSDTSFAVAHDAGGHGYTWTTGDKAALGWIELKAA